MSEAKEETTDIINQGKRKGLIISVSDYIDNKLQPLDFCKKDGEKMYEVLKSLQYEIVDDHKLIGYVKFDKMWDAIFDFFDNSQTAANDTLLFYYSGHGIPISEGNMCLASSETNPDVPKRRSFTSYELTNLIQESNSIKIVEILDCCYSGANKVSKADPDAAAKLGTDAMEKDKRLLQQGEGKYLLAASQAAQEAYGSMEKGHSIFTYYLLQGLRGNESSVDNAGNVTPYSLGKYVYNAILNLPEKKRPKQKPITKTEQSGDIILAHYPDLVRESLLSPSDVQIIYEGLQYLENKDYNEAISSFDKAISISPKNAVGYNHKGDVLFKQEKYEEAIGCYDKALEINQKYTKAWINKGLCLEALDSSIDALKCYDKALEEDAKLSEVWYYKGSILFKLQKYNDAIISLDNALQIDPRHVNSLILKGKSLTKIAEENSSGLDHGKLDEAIYNYSKALEGDPNNVEALYRSGLAFYELEEHDKALTFLERVTIIADAWMKRGNILLDSKKYNEGIYCYDKALEIDPKLTEAWIKKGDSLFQIVLPESSSITDIAELLIRIGYHRKDPKEYLSRAIESYNKALEIDPKLTEAWNKKAAVYVAWQQYAEAVKCLDKILDINNSDVDAWINKGYCCTYLEEYDEAIESLDNALKIDPTNKKAQQYKNAASSTKKQMNIFKRFFG